MESALYQKVIEMVQESGFKSTAVMKIQDMNKLEFILPSTFHLANAGILKGDQVDQERELRSFFSLVAMR